MSYFRTDCSSFSFLFEQQKTERVKEGRTLMDEAKGAKKDWGGNKIFLQKGDKEWTARIFEREEEGGKQFSFGDNLADAPLCYPQRNNKNWVNLKWAGRTSGHWCKQII